MRQFLAFAALLTACLAPAAASALSCMAPNAARSFNWLVESGKPVVVLVGRITPAGPVPVRLGEEDLTATYIFKGVQLGAKAVDADKIALFQLTDRCSAPWCNNLPVQPVEGLFIALAQGVDYVVETGPCTELPHPHPTAEERAALKRCVAAGRCSDADIELFDRRYR